MWRRIAATVSACALVVPLLVGANGEAEATNQIWDSKQVLSRGGLYHVAVDGPWAVVTDYKWESGTGRALVFERVGGTWNRVQTLRSPDAPPATGGDGFGSSVDLHGDVMVIGQVWSGDGVAHVFEFRNGRWRHAARLNAANGTDVTVWNGIIAASGDTPSHYPGAFGKIAIFERSPAGWTKTQTLRRGRDGDFGCVFGYSLDMWDDVLVAGDYFSNEPCEPKVHVFRHDGSTWAREQRLRGMSGYGFVGDSVAVRNGTIVVGDPDLTGADTAHRARVHVFQWNGSRWVRTQRIGRAAQNFGDVVALQGGTLVVGDASLERTWVYTLSGDRWMKVGRLGSSGAGRSVAVTGRYVFTVGTGKAVVYRLMQ